MRGTKLKGVRAAKGYTQQYMADRLDISLSAYQKKERGESGISLDEKRILIDVLELTPEQINECLCDSLVPMNR